MHNVVSCVQDVTFGNLAPEMFVLMQPCAQTLPHTPESVTFSGNVWVFACRCLVLFRKNTVMDGHGERNPDLCVKF